MSPRPSLVPTDADTSGSYGSPSYQQQQQQQQQEASSNLNNNNNSTGGSGSGGAAAKQEPGRRAGACRVCLKSFKPDDYHKTCFECQQRVCEDCASYSKLDDHEDAVSFVICGGGGEIGSEVVAVGNCSENSGTTRFQATRQCPFVGVVKINTLSLSA